MEETVRKVLDIIGEERPFLRAKFQRLVYQNYSVQGQPAAVQQCMAHIQQKIGGGLGVQAPGGLNAGAGSAGL